MIFFLIYKDLKYSRSKIHRGLARKGAINVGAVNRLAKARRRKGSIQKEDDGMRENIYRCFIIPWRY